MRQTASRGGPKPRMLEATSINLSIAVGAERKVGIYEIATRRDVLARRVELPLWVSDLWEQRGGTVMEAVLAAAGPSFKNTPLARPDSGGHIYLHPAAGLFIGPAVGLDIEIYEGLARRPTVKEIRFYVYAQGYKLAGCWTISVDAFKVNAKRVETKPGFMPQMMVPLSALAVKSIVTH